jgi:hypothetical protein
VLPCDRDLVGNLRPPALDCFCLVPPLVFRFLVSNFAAPATLPATSCQLSANWLPGIKNLRVSKYFRTYFLLSLRVETHTRSILSGPKVALSLLSSNILSSLCILLSILSLQLRFPPLSFPRSMHDTHRPPTLMQGDLWHSRKELLMIF